MKQSPLEQGTDEKSWTKTATNYLYHQYLNEGKKAKLYLKLSYDEMMLQSEKCNHLNPLQIMNLRSLYSKKKKRFCYTQEKNLFWTFFNFREFRFGHYSLIPFVFSIKGSKVFLSPCCKEVVKVKKWHGKEKFSRRSKKWASTFAKRLSKEGCSIVKNPFRMSSGNQLRFIILL